MTGRLQGRRVVRTSCSTLGTRNTTGYILTWTASPSLWSPTSARTRGRQHPWHGRGMASNDNAHTHTHTEAQSPPQQGAATYTAPARAVRRCSNRSTNTRTSAATTVSWLPRVEMDTVKGLNRNHPHHHRLLFVRQRDDASMPRRRRKRTHAVTVSHTTNTSFPNSGVNI